MLDKNVSAIKIWDFSEWAHLTFEVSWLDFAFYARTEHKLTFSARLSHSLSLFLFSLHLLYTHFLNNISINIYISKRMSCTNWLNPNVNGISTHRLYRIHVGIEQKIDMALFTAFNILFTFYDPYILQFYSFPIRHMDFCADVFIRFHCACACVLYCTSFFFFFSSFFCTYHLLGSIKVLQSPQKKKNNQIT